MQELKGVIVSFNESKKLSHPRIVKDNGIDFPPSGTMPQESTHKSLFYIEVNVEPFFVIVLILKSNLSCVLRVILMILLLMRKTRFTCFK